MHNFDLPARQLLDAAPDAMVIVDQSGIIVLINKQTESLFGYTRDEILGQLVEVLLPDRYRNRHPKHREQFFYAPKPRPMGQALDLFGLRKDGSEFPIEISLSPVQSEQGSFVASTIRDATVHREREHRLTGILESSLNEIYIFDTQSLRFIQVNEGARKNLGYSMRELSELTAVDIKPNYTAEAFDEVIRPLRDGETESLIFETVHQRKDGSIYPVEVHLQLSNAEAMPVFVAIILDISERHQAEQALRESHEQLEQRVIERTVALEEARAESEKANNGKSRFLAAASHDLRQPLQSLGLYLSVMARQLEAPLLVDVSDKMRKSLDTMCGLLDALLDISKLDSGSVTPEKRDIRLQELLDRIVTDNIQQANEKGIQLECAETDCIVHSDPGLLERVLENFVTNAIRYTEEGRVSIDCQCNEGTARISVTDTGIGIQKADLNNIFEEYYQLDNPVRDRRKGLGLGLSIVKYIARLLDHRIEVTSVPGNGSTFWLEAPLGEPIEVAIAVPPSENNDREPTVLFVDDDPAIVEAATMMLELAGVQVHSGLCGDDALAHLAAGVRPDIVVSDYRLPGYNGVEVVRRVRQATSEDLPTVLMTGDTSGNIIRAAGLSNCTIMHKPVDTDQLISLIKAASPHSTLETKFS